jgi:hypothetical protein
VKCVSWSALLTHFFGMMKAVPQPLGSEVCFRCCKPSRALFSSLIDVSKSLLRHKHSIDREPDHWMVSAVSPAVSSWYFRPVATVYFNKNKGFKKSLLRQNTWMGHHTITMLLSQYIGATVFLPPFLIYFVSSFFFLSLFLRRSFLPFFVFPF